MGLYLSILCLMREKEGERGRRRGRERERERDRREEREREATAHTPGYTCASNIALVSDHLVTVAGLPGVCLCSSVQEVSVEVDRVRGRVS